MRIHYYVSLFPMEALIASQLEPRQFGSYMATGSKKGSAEKIIFAEMEGDFGDYFRWDYAHENCVQHPNGDPKNSLYLAVYRVLENIPLPQFQSLYLTTTDGRSLELEKSGYSPPDQARTFFVYKELCPVNPIVVSSLDPVGFAAYMTDPESLTSVPMLVFTDLKMIDFDNTEITGNIGRVYERKIEHLKDCVFDVTERKGKVNKIFDRSYIESFSYQAVKSGIFIGNGEELIEYPMKSSEELREQHYEWAKSAMIL